MVDNIKPKSPANLAVEQKNSKVNNPRASLEPIQVKGIVDHAMRSSDAIVNVDRGRNTEKVARTLKDLNDAVAHSSLALDALGRIGGNDATQLGQGVDDLKNNIAGVLDSLRERVGTAEVLNENLSAASSRLEDLDQARLQAGDINLQMSFEGKAAIDAHSGLSRERVQQLLSE